MIYNNKKTIILALVGREEKEKKKNEPVRFFRKTNIPAFLCEL